MQAPGAVIVTSVDNFTPGADIYILAGEEWNSMQSLAESVLPKLGEKYAAVITATEAVSGDKVDCIRWYIYFFYALYKFLISEQGETRCHL